MTMRYVNLYKLNKYIYVYLLQCKACKKTFCTVSPHSKLMFSNVTYYPNYMLIVIKRLSFLIPN